MLRDRRATTLIIALIIGAAWAYNAGLKSTPASGLMYIAGFGPIPAYAASTLPGHPWPAWQVTAAAAAVGLGAHFANVLPGSGRATGPGVNGLPQRVAARWGPGAVRRGRAGAAALASVLLLLACPARRWVAVAGLGAAALLA